MLNESVPRLILSFALPATVGMIAGAIYNIVDRIFVGHCVGPIGLAAIIVCFPMMIVMMAFTMLICTGGASRVAILYGSGRIKDAEQALTTVFVLLGSVGLLALFSSFFISAPAIRIAGGKGEVLTMALPYLRIIMIGSPFAMFGFGANFLIRASGKPRYAMCTQLVGAGSNIIFDALFMIAFGMGIEGAAYGTVAAQALSAAFGLAFFWRKDTPLKIRREFIGLPKLDVLKRIISVGSTGFFVEISFVVYMTIMSRLVTKYGGDVGLSVLGIFFSLDSLLFLPALAVGEAAQPIIGYNYGAGSPQRVEKVIYYALFMAVGFYIVTFGIAEIFTEPLIRLFTNDPELIEVGVSGLRIGYLALPFFGVAIVTGAALQGLGKGLPSLILSFVRHVVGLLLPILFMPRIFGYTGVWLSFPCSDMISCLTSVGFLVWVLRWLKTPEALKVK